MARNCAALGARTRLLSVVGTTSPGDALARLLREEGHRGEPAPRREPRARRIKLRVIGRQQQLLRIDFETPPSHEVLAAKLAEFKRALPDCDVVMLSDYGKGGLTHIAEMIRPRARAGKRVLVDPKGDDYARYQGASVLTPNRAELREVVGRWKTRRT